MAGTFGYVGGYLAGALEQLVNTLTDRLSVPLGPLPDVPPGEVLEPDGAAGRAGANAVERAIELLLGDRSRTDAQALRSSRPLLASLTVASAGAGAVTRLAFRAHAPGNDWAAAGRESALVAVYVDGRYHSTVVVLEERGGAHAVNLGELPPGLHRIELRAAPAQGGAAAVSATVSDVRYEAVTGDAALVERHAPVLELRDTDHASARHSMSRNDTPLLMVPAVTRHADGSRTIEYRVFFSNEDGGTQTTMLYARYGRAIDAEPVFRVRLAPDGRVLDEQYQAPIHAWRRFDGEREGSRPVLRVSTANNMVSARVRGAGAERWSDAATPVVDGATSDHAVLRAHPWTWSVMAKELLREGKAVGGPNRGRVQVGDPRRYVYLGPLSDAMRGAVLARGGLELVLADGTRILARVARGFAGGRDRAAALELPAGAVASAVVGVALIGIRAVLLDEQFRPRDLPAAA